jgi:hypothetical protein
VNQFLRLARTSSYAACINSGVVMSSSDRTRGSPAERQETAAPPVAAQDPYGNWLERMQRARARQATITKNLHTWSNYKSWAEQVKGSWDDDQKKK